MIEGTNNLTPEEQKKLDNLNQEVQFRKDWTKAILENQSMQNYFRQFNPDSVQKFIDHYISYKIDCYSWGEDATELRDTHETKWLDLATEHLGFIQQKKLFDLQCLWRAGQIELPGVEIIYDFRYWESNIFNCPFIDPISPEDVALYQHYLTGSNAELEDAMLNCIVGWQEYDEIKKAYVDINNARCHFPEWYDFYNGRKGTGVYMSLPDIKGEKENFYRNLGYVEREKTAKEELAEHIMELLTNRDKEKKDDEGRVILKYDPELIDWFVETFEDKQSKEYHRAFRWMNREDEDDDLDSAFYLLKEAGEYVPIEGYYDWREAIKKAAHNYKAKRIIEALQPAYEQYMINISMGIKFPTEDTERLKIREEIKKEILRGRVANGEPEDLNY